MTTNAYNDMKPGAVPVAFTKLIPASATDTLIWRVPWGNPVNKVFELRKVVIQTNGGSGGAFTLWDQDLSSATPTKNGSGGAPLLTVGGGTTSGGVNLGILDLNQCPQIIFQAGLTCQGSISGMSVAIEGQVY